MNLRRAFLLSSTLLSTVQVVQASETTQDDPFWRQAGEIIDNIFDYTIAQTKAPESIKLVNKTVDHPVFGKMYVISHKDDIDYYNKKSKDTTKETLVNDFLYYVAEISSPEIKPEELKGALLKMAKTKVGTNTLKVITSKYMKAYDKYREFYDKHKDVINEYLYAGKRIDEINKELAKNSNLHQQKYQEVKLLEEKIASGKIELRVSLFGNPLNSNSDKDERYEETYEKFEKYHKLHIKLKSIDKKLKKSLSGDSEQAQLLDKKKRTIEQIMSYDDYTRISYKIFEEVLCTVHRETVKDIYEYAYLQKKQTKYEGLKNKAKPKSEDYKNKKEKYKKYTKEIKKLLDSYKDGDGFKNDADKILEQLRNTFLKKQSNLEEYEKEYFIAKKEQAKNELESIDNKINDLRAERNNLTESKQTIHGQLYARLGQLLKANDRTYTKQIKDMISDSWDFSEKAKDQISIHAFLNNLTNAFKKGQEKQLNQLISKLYIKYEVLENNHTRDLDRNIHTITLGKDIAHNSFKISVDKQILSSKEETKDKEEDVYTCFKIFDETTDGSHLNGIQHESIHFKDNITGTLQKTKKQSIEKLGSSIKITDTFKNGIKSLKKTADDKTIINILDHIYDNTAEMVCMYGVLQHNGAFFFDPLNEALSTAEKDMYFTADNSSTPQTVRTGHKVSLTDMSSFYSKLDQATNIYSWYFNPELRDNADL